MVTHSSILAWRILSQKSLAGYSLWGCKESDMTEQLSTSLMRSSLRQSPGHTTEEKC